MGNSRESLLQEFVDWASDHITGDEKGEAQIFLDRLFRAFGQKGSLDVGGTPELRIRKATEDGGGTAFADYVWKPIVVIEMKKRGTDLAKHFRQAFDYWVRLVGCLKNSHKVSRALRSYNLSANNFMRRLMPKSVMKSRGKNSGFLRRARVLDWPKSRRVVQAIRP
jgi:hypothetical protein